MKKEEIKKLIDINDKLLDITKELIDITKKIVDITKGAVSVPDEEHKKHVITAGDFYPENGSDSTFIGHCAVKNLKE